MEGRIAAASSVCVCVCLRGSETHHHFILSRTIKGVGKGGENEDPNAKGPFSGVEKASWHVGKQDY